MAASARVMEIADPLDRLRPDQRNVAREHQHGFETLQGIARFHHGVPGAALLALQDEVDAGGGQRLAHSLGFVSDDREDVLRRNDFAGGRHHVRQQRLSGDLVQDLGAARLQPRAFARGEDRDGELAGFVLSRLGGLEVGFAISIQRIAAAVRKKSDSRNEL